MECVCVLAQYIHACVNNDNMFSSRPHARVCKQVRDVLSKGGLNLTTKDGCSADLCDFVNSCLKLNPKERCERSYTEQTHYLYAIQLIHVYLSISMSDNGGLLELHKITYTGPRAVS